MFSLYIDPGTGSMLFSLVIGLVATLTFGLRALFIKIRFGFDKKDIAEDKDVIPYVIFSDHKRYWNVFSPICQEFEKRGIDVVYYTLSSDDPALCSGMKHLKAEYLGEGNKPFAKLNFLNADIVLSTTPGLDVYQWKRSKNVKCYVHIPHTVDDLTGYRMFGLDHYDVLLASGPNQIAGVEKIEALRPTIAKKEKVVEGSTQLDELKKKYDENHRKERNQIPVVLVAPSWGKSGILSKYGDGFLSALEKTGFEIIVRPHPQSFTSEKALLDSLIEKHPSISWNRDNDNFSVLDKSDILITDFSGIIFEYALVFKKPLIYADTEFDSLPYDTDWLDEEYWSLRKLPQIGFKLEENSICDIKDVICRALDSQELSKGREELENECWNCIGKAGFYCAEYLIEKRRTLLEGKGE